LQIKEIVFRHDISAMRIVGEKRNIIRVVTPTKSPYPDTGIRVVYPRVRVRVRVHSKTGTSRVAYKSTGAGRVNESKFEYPHTPHSLRHACARQCIFDD